MFTSISRLRNTKPFKFTHSVLHAFKFTTRIKIRFRIKHEKATKGFLPIIGLLYRPNQNSYYQEWMQNEIQFSILTLTWLVRTHIKPHKICGSELKLLDRVIWHFKAMQKSNSCAWRPIRDKAVILSKIFDDFVPGLKIGAYPWLLCFERFVKK